MTCRRALEATENDLDRAGVHVKIANLWLALGDTDAAISAVDKGAELALARGEPELALETAVDAQSLDQLGERAVRLQILAHEALGARSAAVETADRILERLGAAGLRPEPETRSLVSRLTRNETRAR